MPLWGASVGFVDLDKIYIPQNHRRSIDKDKIKTIAASLKKNGQLQAIRVHKRTAEQIKAWDKNKQPYILAFGERRIIAARRIGWTQIRADIMGPIDDISLEAYRAAENLDRENLSPIEEADAVRLVFCKVLGRASIPATDTALTDNATIGRVASELGRPTGWVRDRAYMARCCEQVRRLADVGLLTAGHLRELAKIGDDIGQATAALSALGGWSFSVNPTDNSIAKDVEKMIADIGTGERRCIKISDLKKAIDKLQRSLKTVSFTLEHQVPGTPTLRACDGCPSNTSTDKTLFGSEGGKNGVGTCMDRKCFDEKGKRAEKQKTKTADKLVKLKLPATPANVKKHGPTWLKPGPALRAAQAAQAKKGAKGKAGKKASKAASSSDQDTTSPGKSPKVKHKEALATWWDKTRDKIGDAIKARPALFPAVLLLGYSKRLERFKDYDKPKHLTPALLHFLSRHLVDTKDKELLDLTGDMSINEFQLQRFLQMTHESVLLHVASRLNVEPPKRPALEDFKPKVKAAKTSKPTKKKAAKKVAKKTKKKAVKKVVKKPAKKKAAKKKKKK